MNAALRTNYCFLYLLVPGTEHTSSSSRNLCTTRQPMPYNPAACFLVPQCYCVAQPTKNNKIIALSKILNSIYITYNRREYNMLFVKMNCVNMRSNKTYALPE